MEDGRLEFETFRTIGSYEIDNLTQKESSCFNGMVRVRRFKVTVEPIDEPIEVIHARIQNLWERSDNYHDSTPLQNAAKKYGYELKGDRGSKRERRIR